MESNNKRIARNAIMLYIRMLISMFVGLYTSRIVLQVLGASDYGIYGVVGGIVSMFSFLNASMSGATSRFLTYELGKKNNFGRLKDTFSSAFVFHICIALVILLLSETIGLWFLYNKLVIPEERMFAAHIVFQCSVLGMIVNVTQVPYNASIISHEHMDIYAYVELLNVFLKLIIVYLLLLWNFDKLVLYAFLSLSISIFIAGIYRLYCERKFEECKFSLHFNRELVKPMLSFSGYDMFGNMSVVFFMQGTSFLLNMFFGPILNAANSISNTVQGTIKGFAYNVIQAFRPQIIKQFSNGEMQQVSHLTVLATQSTLVLYTIIAMPIFFNADYVLHLWLGEVPVYTSIFLQIILLGTLFNLANLIVNIPIHAKGDMKVFSIVSGSWFIISIFIMYFLLIIKCSPVYAYSILVFTYVAVIISDLIILKKNIPSYPIKNLLIDGYFKYFICFIVIVAINFYLSFIFTDALLFLIFSFIYSLIIWACSFLFVMLSKHERMVFLTYLKKRLHSINFHL